MESATEIIIFRKLIKCYAYFTDMDNLNILILISNVHEIRM